MAYSSCTNTPYAAQNGCFISCVSFNGNNYSGEKSWVEPRKWALKFIHRIAVVHSEAQLQKLFPIKYKTRSQHVKCSQKREWVKVLPTFVEPTSQFRYIKKYQVLSFSWENVHTVAWKWYCNICWYGRTWNERALIEYAAMVEHYF